VQPAQANVVRRELGSRLITYAERWFDIPEGSIQNPRRRNGNISRARWAVAHVLNAEAGWSQPKIAKLYACDPSSIHTGWLRAKELLRSDAVFFDAVERLQREIAPQ
jgi:hypothetical protein